MSTSQSCHDVIVERRAKSQNRRAPAPSSGSRAYSRIDTHDASLRNQTRSPLEPAPYRRPRACPTALWPSRLHRSGSTQQLSKPHHTRRRMRRGPLDRHFGRALAQLDPDGWFSRHRWLRLCDPYRNKGWHDRQLRCRPSSAFRLDHPSSQQVRVQASCQGHRCDRNARMLARRNRFVSKRLTMSPPSPGLVNNQLTALSVHVSTS